MTKTLHTPYGTVKIDTVEALYQQLTERFNRLQVTDSGGSNRIALSGGGTPRAFYRWCVEHEALSLDALNSVIWFVSDERLVPLDHEDSNFGLADRELLAPLGIDEERKVPFPVEMEPTAGVSAFNKAWRERYGAQAGFNLCLLGMGGDGHTASLFPGSPLLGTGIMENFAAVQVPEKGWRYTVTEAGLSHSMEIVILVTGAGKATRIGQVFNGDFNTREMPIQIVRGFSDKVTWLIDEAAASELE